ncbi:MAG: acyl-CoA thioesterase [Bacteroidaceae bacterium]|nr:acyl-CoA thioesterase [Bacteroidaceae bacterium]
MPYRHTLPIQIRFSDVDRFGHVNNNAYFAYYDLGKQEYMRSVLGPDVFDGDIVPVVVNINVDFLAPVHYGDAVSVETSIVRLGNKSFTLDQRAVRTDTGQELCRCRTVMVCVRRDDGQSVPIPAPHRTKISAFEGMECG